MSKETGSIFDVIMGALPWRNSGGSKSDSKSSLIVAAAVAASLPLAYYTLLAPKRKPYPPGPPGLPILGNLLDLPPPDSEQFLDQKFAAW